MIVVHGGNYWDNNEWAHTVEVSGIFENFDAFQRVVHFLDVFLELQ